MRKILGKKNSKLCDFLQCLLCEAKKSDCRFVCLFVSLMGSMEEKYECCRCLEGNISSGRLSGPGLVGKKKKNYDPKWLMDLEKVAELRVPEASPEVPVSGALKKGKSQKECDYKVVN